MKVWGNQQFFQKQQIDQCSEIVSINQSSGLIMKFPLTTWGHQLLFEGVNDSCPFRKVGAGPSTWQFCLWNDPMFLDHMFQPSQLVGSLLFINRTLTWMCSCLMKFISHVPESRQRNMSHGYPASHLGANWWIVTRFMAIFYGENSWYRFAVQVSIPALLTGMATPTSSGLEEDHDTIGTSPCTTQWNSLGLVAQGFNWIDVEFGIIFFLNRNKQKEGGPVWNRQLHAPSHSNRMRGKCSNENATFVLGFGVILESWISEAPTKVLLQPTTGSVQVMKHVVSQLRRSTYIKEKRIYQLLGSPVDHGSDGLIGFLLGREVFMVGDL